MVMKRKWTVITGALAVAGLIAIGQHACAQSPLRTDRSVPELDLFDHSKLDAQAFSRGHREGRGVPSRGALLPGFMEELELSATQDTQLKDLRHAFAKDMALLRADLALAHVELRELFQSVTPSVTAAKRLGAKVNAARAKIFERTVTFRVEARNVLTPGQQENLQDQSRQKKHGNQSEGGPGPRGFRGGSPVPPPSEIHGEVVTGIVMMLRT